MQNVHKGACGMKKVGVGVDEIFRTTSYKSFQQSNFGLLKNNELVTTFFCYKYIAGIIKHSTKLIM